MTVPVAIPDAFSAVTRSIGMEELWLLQVG